jgi:carbon-monoxide dehydrogenase small subunit
MAAELILDLRVNGDRVRRLVPANRSLLDFLREDLRLTGSKHGCDIGDCGACTVLIDGQPALACISLAAQAEGREVTTIEGLSTPRQPVASVLQSAFDQHVAAQCGYCTPGFVVQLTHLLEQHPGATEDQLREALAANICRCTGYTKILAAARQARDELA